MENWKEYRLGDVVDYYKGYAFNSNLYSDEGVMVVRVSDFTSDSISCDNAVYIEPSEKYEKFRLKENDILIQTVGSWANNPNSIVGKVVRVPKICSNSFLNQNIVKIFPKDYSINNDFLFYYLKATKFSEYCVIRGQGAANQASITLNTIFRYPLIIPPLPTQRRIASILSTYDALIQNYKRQIAALQSAASELYKEWFVRFRFPGYKNAKFDNGLPVGWKYEQFKDIAKFDRGISYSSDEIDCEDGLNLINLKNIEAFGGFRRDGTKKYNGKYKKEQIVTTGDLVMGITDMTQDRRTVGSVALIPDIEGTCVISADLLKLTTKISNIFVYALCRYGEYSRYFSMFANGANVLHLRPDALLRKKILVPNKELIDKFVSIVSIIIKRTNNLNTEIDNLTTQRDLLLPRLMSGKLSVE